MKGLSEAALHLGSCACVSPRLLRACVRLLQCNINNREREAEREIEERKRAESVDANSMGDDDDDGRRWSPRRGWWILFRKKTTIMKEAESRRDT